MKTIIALALFALSAPTLAQQVDSHAHHAEMDHSVQEAHAEAAPDASGCTEEHAAMGHCAMDSEKAKEACDDCCEGADCKMDCCKDGDCDMECCEDGAMQCDGDKDCCADMKTTDHSMHQNQDA